MREPILVELRGDEFLRWEAARDEKYELLHGFVLAFAGGTLDHDRISRNLGVAFDDLFAEPCRSFGSDVKVKAAENTFFYADAGVFCEPLPGDTVVVERPRVVAEVLSPNTRGYDLIEKRAAYRGIASLAAYVVVYTDMRRIEVDARSRDGTWQISTYESGNAFVDGRRLSFAAVYARTSLAS